MKDMTPRCPHCGNLTLIGTLASRLVALCNHCDNGYALAGPTYERLRELPSQLMTRHQLEVALEKAMAHLTTVTQRKQDELLAQEDTLPKDSDSWTPEVEKEVAAIHSQRMMYAGVLQGATSFRDVLLRALGLPMSTISAIPVPPAPAAGKTEAMKPVAPESVTGDGA